MEDMALVNIVRTEIITEEDIPVTHTWETADEAGLVPDLSEGAEQILRVKNRIIATNRTEDIVIGFGINFKDNVFNPEVFALVDGGELIYDEDETTVKKYKAPVAGIAVDRTPFTLSVYTEKKDMDGDILGYVKFIYKHCKGKPAEYSIKDGEFMVPELSMISRPKKGESPVEMEFLKTLD